MLFAERLRCLQHLGNYRLLDLANSSGFIVRNFASAVGKNAFNAPTRMKAVYHCFATGSPCPLTPHAHWKRKHGIAQLFFGRN